MYQVYIDAEKGYDGRKLIGEFGDYSEALEKIEAELAKDENLKYVIEEITGSVNIWGELETRVVSKN